MSILKLLQSIKEFIVFFPQQRKLMGLQPRTAPVCTGAGPGSGSTGSGEGSEGSGGLEGFGAEPGQVQQGSGEGSGRLWCRARSGSTGFWIRFRRRSGRLWCRAGQVQQVPEKVPEKVAEKVPGGFGAKPGRVPEKVKVPEKVGEALVQPGQVQQGSGEGSALGFAARFRKICKHKTLRLLGIQTKLIF